MIIILNGERFQVADGCTISELLKKMELHPAGVAVEYNRRIIRKADYDGTILKENDAVEIVHFVGGG